MMTGEKGSGKEIKLEIGNRVKRGLRAIFA